MLNYTLRFRFLAISLVSLFFSFCFSSAIFADQDTQNLQGGYGTAQSSQQALAAQPVDPYLGPAGNAQSLYTNTPVLPFTITQSGQFLFNFFATTPNATASSDIANNLSNALLSFSPPSNITQATSSDAIQAQLNAVCAANYWTGGQQAVNNCLQQQNSQKAAAMANVDVSSLLSPLVYQPGQKGQEGQAQMATNYIASVAGLSTPFPIIDLNKIAKNNNTDVVSLVTQNPAIQKYLADLKTYAAMQATGVSTLTQLFAERQPSSPDQNSPAYAAMKALNMPNASALQLENYMATRRITDPVSQNSWLAQLSNDGPTALMRAMVVLLAENLAEQYNTRMSIERLTAVMAVIELQQQNAMRQTLQTEMNNVTAPPPTGK